MVHAIDKNLHLVKSILEINFAVVYKRFYESYYRSKSWTMSLYYETKISWMK